MHTRLLILTNSIAREDLTIIIKNAHFMKAIDEAGEHGLWQALTIHLRITRLGKDFEMYQSF